MDGDMTVKQQAGVTREEFKEGIDKLRDTIDKWRAPVQARLEKHESTLYGNGVPGMDEQIRNINGWIEAQKELALKRKQWWDKLQWVVIPIFVGGLVTLMYQAFVFFTEIAPILESLKNK
jgi:hypothetical protein